MVSPYIGEWIEILAQKPLIDAIFSVSPYIGEWIEILLQTVAC